MDLIYMNANKEDIGVLKDYIIDLAYGESENDFECQVNINNNVCEAGYYLYFEGEEYGGIIDSVEVDTEAEIVTYKGRTWHGILDSKIFRPDLGDDYLVLNGEANTVIKELLSRFGLTGFFNASTANSGINISNYKMDRYISGYQGILKMLRNASAKLNISFTDGFAVLSARPLIDYTEQDDFDNDQISFKIEKNYNPINHVICLGKGELKDRQVIHLYADELGNISGIQTQMYMNEVVAVYDYANTESEEELIKGGVKLIQDAWNKDKVDFSFNSNDEYFDINDIIGANELVTGTVVKARIAKKIVKLERDLINIAYECESEIKTVASGGYPSNESTSDLTIRLFPWFNISGDENGDMYCEFRDEQPNFTIEDGKLYLNNPRSNMTSFETEIINKNIYSYVNVTS